VSRKLSDREVTDLLNQHRAWTQWLGRNTVHDFYDTPTFTTRNGVPLPKAAQVLEKQRFVHSCDEWMAKNATFDAVIEAVSKLESHPFLQFCLSRGVDIEDETQTNHMKELFMQFQGDDDA
jgi:hypothetical protein